MEKIKALLYSETRPSQKQEARFSAFLRKKYGKGVKLEWIESGLFPGGFRLEVGSDVYDWSVRGRFEQLKRRIDRINGAAVSEGAKVGMDAPLNEFITNLIHAKELLY